MANPAVSAPVEDYVKVIYSLTLEHHQTASTSEIADRLGITAGSVSTMVKRMDASPVAMTLAATKTIPVDSMALILGIHRVLSGAFVFVNIISNAVATLVVAQWENALDRVRLKTELG